VNAVEKRKGFPHKLLFKKLFEYVSHFPTDECATLLRGLDGKREWFLEPRINIHVYPTVSGAYQFSMSRIARGTKGWITGELSPQGLSSTLVCGTSGAGIELIFNVIFTVVFPFVPLIFPVLFPVYRYDISSAVFASLFFCVVVMPFLWYQTYVAKAKLLSELAKTLRLVYPDPILSENLEDTPRKAQE
jgi:hypothetical protein